MSLRRRTLPPVLLLTALLLAGCRVVVPLSEPPRRLPFDLDAPGTTPELFAPGVLSTEDAVELNAALSPDGRELLFTRVAPDGTFVMYGSRKVEERWTRPEPIAPYAGGVRAMAVDMAWSSDGRELVFLGRAPGGVADPPELDLWRMERDAVGGWSPAEVIPPPVSTVEGESYPCLVADGSLYFSSRRAGGLGDLDVYRAQRLPDGSFAEPVNLGAPVNTEHADGDTWVSPDESVLVVASRRPGGHGGADLWISRRRADGGWSEPRNLGSVINTAGYEYCPMGTWDGTLFFFSRRVGDTWAETTGGTVHWVDASVLRGAR